MWQWFLAGHGQRLIQWKYFWLIYSQKSILDSEVRQDQPIQSGHVSPAPACVTSICPHIISQVKTQPSPGLVCPYRKELGWWLCCDAVRSHWAWWGRFDWSSVELWLILARWEEVSPSKNSSATDWIHFYWGWQCWFIMRFVFTNSTSKHGNCLTVYRCLALTLGHVRTYHCAFMLQTRETCSCREVRLPGLSWGKHHLNITGGNWVVHMKLSIRKSAVSWKDICYLLSPDDF